MPKNSVAEWDVVPANNTEIAGIGIIGSSAVSNFDDAMRTMMSQLKTDSIAARPIAAGGTGATTAEAARTALGVAKAQGWVSRAPIVLSSTAAAVDIAISGRKLRIVAETFNSTLSSNTAAALSFDGGATFVTAASYLQAYFVHNGTTPVAIDASTTSSWLLSGANNTVNGGGFFQAIIYPGTVSKVARYRSDFSALTNTSQVISSGYFEGYFNNVGTLPTHIRIFPSSGIFNIGTNFQVEELIV